MTLNARSRFVCSFGAGRSWGGVLLSCFLVTAKLRSYTSPPPDCWAICSHPPPRRPCGRHWFGVPAPLRSQRFLVSTLSTCRRTRPPPLPAEDGVGYARRQSRAAPSPPPVAPRPSHSPSPGRWRAVPFVALGGVPARRSCGLYGTLRGAVNLVDRRGPPRAASGRRSALGRGCVETQFWPTAGEFHSDLATP